MLNMLNMFFDYRHYCDTGYPCKSLREVQNAILKVSIPLCSSRR